MKLLSIIIAEKQETMFEKGKFIWPALLVLYSYCLNSAFKTNMFKVNINAESHHILEEMFSIFKSILTRLPPASQNIYETLTGSIWKDSANIIIFSQPKKFIKQ